MAYIKSIKCFTPPHTLDNNALQEQLKNSCVEKTAKGVGVSNRHIASNDTTAGDMTVEAANLLFEKSGIKREEIDFIISSRQQHALYRTNLTSRLQQELSTLTLAAQVMCMVLPLQEVSLTADLRRMYCFLLETP